MEAIENLTHIDYILVVLSLFAVLYGLREIINLFLYFKNKFRIKTGIEEDKETIESRLSTIESKTTILEKHDNWQYEQILKISEGIEDIQNSLVNKEIEDMRKTILDFCSALSNGQYQNKEAYNFIFKTYQKYEEILEKFHKENSVIDESMKFISERYQEFLRAGNRYD